MNLLSSMAFETLNLPTDSLGSENRSVKLLAVAEFSPLPSPKDITYDILNQWRRTCDLPALSDLPESLNRPLPDEAKIPLRREFFDMITSPAHEFKDRCTPEDVALLFRVSDDEVAPRLSSAFVDTIMEAPPDDNSPQNTFIRFWDGNISKILKMTLPHGYHVRGTGRNRSSREIRPDYEFHIGDFVPFRGEENAPTSLNFVDNPRREMKEKMAWIHDPAPFILGYMYYANGTGVTLVAICPPKTTQENPEVVNLIRASLRTKAGRIRHAVRMINLSSAIAAIADMIGP